MSETFRINQRILVAAADVLWASGVLKPDADGVTVMVALAHLLQAIDRVRARSEREGQDIDPMVVRRLVVPHG